ncbi:hypothetical protein P7K49_014928 [Saguinus oedipus]|uniref:Uncharacterized protein n=1 Tax=Saguinus oedipus TaxID=9490 RepID=A0ABQ9V911_SAGOE|nr:hypothetical protein P7K49_014928 [Saguinus oedipus]
MDIKIISIITDMVSGKYDLLPWIPLRALPPRHVPGSCTDARLSTMPQSTRICPQEPPFTASTSAPPRRRKQRKESEEGRDTCVPPPGASHPLASQFLEFPCRECGSPSDGSSEPRFAACLAAVFSQACAFSTLSFEPGFLT